MENQLCKVEHIEKARRAKYYVKNREKILAQHKKYNKAHKEQRKARDLKNIDRIRAYRRKDYIKVKKVWEKYPWRRLYHSVLTRTNNKSNAYYKRGIKNFLTVWDVMYLFLRDDGWSLKKPSIDRISGRGNYELGNCRIIELTDNLRRTN